ncbi:MAG: hypothetical protein UU93_C0010G0014 [Candidatus Amesbacteria bacterium GW2011_GWA2_42_12]|uniref:Serine aminopeptidase S33 domain-containing protein n=1 Tax=Candidatus Amesbacteria bacterium GW2011_GWA2_42_12 TaxID=1618356 RepID=A0A0G0Y5W8_9BACT|nr:MAG: hypothetical protein UU93_C0010G0014 [Candidatus Amesbacteria bacterium GW2011_GWA2_42_12]
MKRYIELQKFLAHNSISSFTYDYQGTGESEGNIEKTTISNFINDTYSAFSKFKKELEPKRIYILGYSLGGYIVPHMLNEFRNTSGIILISPPAYAQGTENLYLNSQNTELIRSKLQNKNSDIFKYLEAYNLAQRVLIIFGEKDLEIPPEIKAILKTIKNKSFEYISIKKGVHSLLRNRTQLEKTAKNKLLQTIYRFIAGNIYATKKGK